MSFRFLLFPVLGNPLFLLLNPPQILKTRWRRLWSDRALSCFSEVVFKVQNRIPCKTQDFIHEPCSVDVKKWSKNIGGAPKNSLCVVFAVAKTRFLEKNDFENMCPTHIPSSRHTFQVFFHLLAHFQYPIFLLIVFMSFPSSYSKSKPSPSLWCFHCQTHTYLLSYFNIYTT